MVVDRHGTDLAAPATYAAIDSMTTSVNGWR
jgi:hypothetical protein